MEEQVLIWQDILINRKLSPGDITAALASIFSVDPMDVCVVNEIGPGTPSESALVLAEATEVAGEYPLLLSVYARSEEAESPDSLDGATQLARQCACRCLISDDSTNPYSMKLVLPDGSIKSVFLDAQQLEQGRYCLAPER